MEEIFSPSQEMTKNVDSYLKGGKLLEDQDSLVETWIAVEESWLVQLLRNAYKRESNHQSNGPDF